MLPLSLAEAALVLASLAALGGAGWAFVNARLYREESERDAVAQARPSHPNAGLCVSVRAARRSPHAPR